MNITSKILPRRIAQRRQRRAEFWQVDPQLTEINEKSRGGRGRGAVEKIEWLGLSVPICPTTITNAEDNALQSRTLKCRESRWGVGVGGRNFNPCLVSVPG